MLENTEETIENKAAEKTSHAPIAVESKQNEGNIIQFTAKPEKTQEDIIDDLVLRLKNILNSRSSSVSISDLCAAAGVSKNLVQLAISKGSYKQQIQYSELESVVEKLENLFCSSPAVEGWS